MKLKIILMIEMILVMTTNLKIKTINNYEKTKSELEYASSQIYISFLKYSKNNSYVITYLKSQEIDIFNEEITSSSYRYTLQKKYFSYEKNKELLLTLEKYFTY
jgi:hypothetical protein